MISGEFMAIVLFQWIFLKRKIKNHRRILQMFIKGSELDFKASSYALAKNIHIDEGCRNSVSVNIEHTGDTVNITPCEYDGSAYIITDDIGAVNGEISLIRMLFLGYNRILYIIDKGELAYRDGDKAYVINNRGDVRELSEVEQDRKVYWYKYDKSVHDCACTYLQKQSKMDYITVEKYLFNFIITFSLNYENDCATTRYYNVDDVMTREYGVRYIKKSDIPVIDNSKADAEDEEYIEEDELESYGISNSDNDINEDDEDNEDDYDTVFTNDEDVDEDVEEDYDTEEDDLEFENE